MAIGQRRGRAVVLPGHLATLGCESSSKAGSGRQGGGERAGRKGRGWGGGERRDEEKREIDITSHLTFL